MSTRPGSDVWAELAGLIRDLEPDWVVVEHESPKGITSEPVPEALRTPHNGSDSTGIAQMPSDTGETRVPCPASTKHPQTLSGQHSASERARRVRDLRRQGWSVWKISQELGISWDEARAHLWPRPSADGERP